MSIKPKKLLAGLLAVTMSLSSSLTSFAVEGSAQGNNGAGVVTGKGGDFSANMENGGNGMKSGKIGVRLSLVDAKNPSEVISVDNDGNPRVVDILYVNKDAFAYQTGGQYYSKLFSEFTFTSVKTQPLISMADGKQKIKTIFYDDLNAQFPGESSMPPWLIHTNGKYTSRGEEFVNWCTSDSFGNQAIGDDGTGKSGEAVLTSF